MFSKRIPLYYVAIAMLLGGVAAYFIFRYSSASNTITQPVAENGGLPIDTTDCNYTLSRLGGYRYIKPLLITDQSCESEKYAALEKKLTAEMDKFKKEGTITSGSVFIRDFDEEAWISINTAEKYDLGSLLRLPVLITVLYSSEYNSAFMDKELLFDKPSAPVINDPALSKPKIQPGHKYKVRDLLRYMIVNSDNEATRLLTQNIDRARFNKFFTDLGVPVPPQPINNYPVTVKEFSAFLNVLYDGGYITYRNSEYAISLLSECEFGEGLAKGLPEGVKIAHKFGERTDSKIPEFHETGIVYLDKSPYLIGVAAKGPDVKKLPALVSRLSTITYEEMVKNN